MIALPNPFRGLVPYTENDQLYGRDGDLTLMKDRIFRARTTLLFAGSGVGKTSFFQAKLIPEIARRYQTQFRLFYHNSWTARDPLAALKQTLALDHGQPLQAAFQPATGKSGSSIVVLDQFEELFQHHLYWSRFDTFRDELSALINDSSIQVLVVFSMREEFLGQLSAFDNRIPDVFGNYYRLKNPDKLQARDIIEQTVNRVGADVHAEGLVALVDDLSRIEVRGSSRRSKMPALSMQRDYVVPPHLQLVCQKLWDDEVRQHEKGDGRFEFLADYAARRQQGQDRAREMLVQFCVDAMNDLSVDQRAAAARAFDFLVTSQGAKMAYELKSLARHMGTPEQLLGPTLEKLADVKMLRRQERQDERWYELYHDMYAPIVWEWKERFESDRRLESEAAVFDRKAIGAEACAKRDEALIYWLKALVIRDTEDRRRQAARLSAELLALKQTFRHEGRITAVHLSSDGTTLLTATTSVVQGLGPTQAAASVTPRTTSRQTAPREVRLVQMWNATSGEPRYAPAALEGEPSALELCANDRIAALVADGVSFVDARSKTVLRHHKLPTSFQSSLTLTDSGRSVVAVFGLPASQWRILPTDGRLAKARRPMKKGTHVTVDARGQYVLTRSPGRLQLMDAMSGKTAGVEIRIRDTVTDVAFGVRPGLVAVGCATGRCEVWDARDGTRVTSVTTSAEPVAKLGFAKADSALYVVRASPQAFSREVSLVQLWDLKRGSVAGAVTLGFSSRQIDVDRLAQYVLTGWPLPRVIDVRRGLTLDAPWDGDKEAGIAFTGADTRVLSADTDGRVRIWDVEALTPRDATIHEPLGFTYVVVDEKCERMVAATSTGRAYLWRIGGKVTPGPAIASSGIPVTHVTMHPTGRWAATRDAKGQIVIWDTETGRAVASQKSPLDSFVFHPKDEGLLLFGRGASARLWWFGTRRAPINLRVRVATAMFSPDGRHAALRNGSAVWLFDARSGRRVGKLPGHFASSAMTFSADGRYIATAGDDPIVRLWKTPTGSPAGELQHLGSVNCMVFSPEGRFLATSGSEQLLRVWDVQDVAAARERGRFRHESEVQDLSFSDDEQTVLAATRSRLHAFRIERWHGRPPGLGDELSPRGSRDLTGNWLFCRLLDRQGYRARAVVYSSYWALHVVSLRFDAVEVEPIQGKPKALLAHWQKRLALRVEGERIVPSAILTAAQPAGEPAEGRGVDPVSATQRRRVSRASSEREWRR